MCLSIKCKLNHLCHKIFCSCSGPFGTKSPGDCMGKICLLMGNDLSVHLIPL